MFLQIVVQLLVDFGDIWVSEITFWSILGALGVPGETWGVQCRFLIDFGSLLGVPLGHFWVNFGTKSSKRAVLKLFLLTFVRSLKVERKWTSPKEI